MTKDELKKWEFLTRKYPEIAGLAYEIYLLDKKKEANLTTYFMWAGKTARRKEQRYQAGLKKFCSRELQKMENKDVNETNKLFI